MSRISLCKPNCPFTIQNDQIYFSSNYNISLKNYHRTINNFKSLKYEAPSFINKTNAVFEIPINITSVELTGCYNNSVILSPNTTCVVLGSFYDKFIELTRNVKYADFGTSHVLENSKFLPKQLNHLVIRCWESNLDFDLNKNLIRLQMILHHDYDFDDQYDMLFFEFCKNPILILNKKLHEYQVPKKLGKQVILSKNLLYLYIGLSSFHQCVLLDRHIPIMLPKSILKIKFSGKLNCHIILPLRLTYLMIDNIYQLKPTIVENPIDTIIIIHNNYHLITDNLPSGTKHIGICNPHKNYPMNNLPPNVQSIWVPKRMYKNACKVFKHLVVETKYFYDLIE